MPISVVFDPPLPSDSPSTFNTKAFTLLGDLNDWSTQANALPGEVATNLTTLLAAPPAIGSTTPAAVSATTLSASGATTLSGTLGAGNTTVTNTAGSSADLALVSSSRTWALLAPGTSWTGGFKYLSSGYFGIYDSTAAETRLLISTTGAVTIPGSLGVNSPITLTAANPYISFVGTSATQNWRLGDGLGAVNGNLVLYDYTSSVKAIEVTKGTGAVTIPGSVTAGAVTVASTATGGFSVVDLTTNGNDWEIGAGGSSSSKANSFYIQDITNSAFRFVIDPTGASTFNSGTFGYGTGAGGTVTQATSKSTAVTLNKPSGQITMNNAALAAGASVQFQLNNTFIANTDIVLVSTSGGTADASYYNVLAWTGSGSALIVVRNMHSASLSDALVLNFAVVKGIAS